MRFKGVFLSAAFLLTGCVTGSSGNGVSGNNYTPVPKTKGFGDTVEVGKLEFRANSASNTKKVGTEYLGDETSNNFVIVNLTIKNKGNSEITLTSGMMELHVGEKTYEPHSSGIYLDDGFYVLESIGPDISTTKNVLFETPSEYTSDYYLVVKESAYSYTTEKIYLK